MTQENHGWEDYYRAIKAPLCPSDISPNTTIEIFYADSGFMVVEFGGGFAMRRLEKL